MLKTFMQLLDKDVAILRRYLWLAVSYGLLCGLTITTLAPALGLLLAGDAAGAMPWLAALLTGTAICWAWRRQVERVGIRVGVAVLQGGRHRLGEHVARLPVGWFTAQNTARLGHIVTQGMMSVAQLPAHVFTPVICGVVTPLVMVAALFALHWPLGLIALAALPLLAGVFLLTGRIARRADETYHAHFADASQRMVEFAQAQSVLRAFNGEGGGTRFLEQAVERQRQSAARLIWQSALAAVCNVWAVQAVFAALLIAATLWMNQNLGGTLAGAEMIGAIVALLLVGRFIDPLLEVAGYAEVLRGARGQLEAIEEIYAGQALPETAAPQAPRDASVELRDVHFRYAPDAPQVLCGASLHIAPGSMTALIGASGSGKTTLVRLIARFFDVSQGSVLVGGVDVRQMSHAQLAGQLSQIFQDNYLFAGSIADNIRVGKPDASDDEIMAAARQAGVAEIIERLPQGMATLVGEGGARLSGGERQRIAIARALVKDAPILLVDEATAALDAENQAAIADTLARLRGQRTLIVIAHQLSTVAMADQIVVLDEGRVVEQGTPAQLRASQGLYAQFLAQRQAAKGWRIAAAPVTAVAASAAKTAMAAATPVAMAATEAPATTAAATDEANC
ncbi:ABC transporter ATP-binding protein [Pseudoduganella violacea]|uniref:ATP-binding cassette subfamily B protein n=1 Tax=Pseudoduganella violacea TaxID=1715466 RepID=A0A7W5B916_9BURK|nr:ABC transporter ATP-binding protein [Pseudoduganella violacea]MBB3118784.1 ATP-binding cassette subfamily B protein [Pseudoduganella violacea]